MYFLCRVHAVTMQAQRAAPPDMICKDKFLIQTTVVPVGTTEEMIISSLVCVFNSFSSKLRWKPYWKSLYYLYFLLFSLTKMMVNMSKRISSE